MDELLIESRAGDRFAALLVAGFAGIVLMLAVLGIYGVMSFAVAQRSREIGVRLALGADQRNVMSLILKEGMILAGLGLALGFGGAFLVGRVMRGFWYQVRTIDFSVLSKHCRFNPARRRAVGLFPARTARRTSRSHARLARGLVTRNSA